MAGIQGANQASASQRIAQSRVHNPLRELNVRAVETSKSIKNLSKTVQHRGIQLIGPNMVDMTV